jgi:hypothetical protein
MIRSRRVPASRVVLCLLAIASLPYTPSRCVRCPVEHTRCRMSAAGDAHSLGEHGSDHGAHVARPEQHEHRNGAPLGCCHLTGKRQVYVAFFTPLQDPAALITVLPATAFAETAQATASLPLFTLGIAHGPPRYLLHATLLI